MKKFQKSLALLDSIIVKLQKNFGVSKQIENSCSGNDDLKCNDSKGFKKQEIVHQTEIKEDKQSCQQVEAKSVKTDQTKQENNKKKPKSSPVSANPDQELIELFSKIELRVGQIEHVEPVADSEKLYASKVNMGNHVRTILSGTRKHITQNGMSGKVIVFANLKPKKLAGQTSEGMLMCSKNHSDTILELLRPPENAKVGDLVSLIGVKESVGVDFKFPNGKTVDLFLALLKTDSEKRAIYDKFFLGIDETALPKTNVDNGTIS